MIEDTFNNTRFNRFNALPSFWFHRGGKNNLPIYDRQFHQTRKKEKKVKRRGKKVREAKIRLHEVNSVAFRFNLICDARTDTRELKNRGTFPLSTWRQHRPLPKWNENSRAQSRWQILARHRHGFAAENRFGKGWRAIVTRPIRGGSPFRVGRRRH